jgi:hypothetical protein
MTSKLDYRRDVKIKNEKFWFVKPINLLVQHTIHY